MAEFDIICSFGVLSRLKSQNDIAKKWSNILSGGNLGDILKGDISPEREKKRHSILTCKMFLKVFKKEIRTMELQVYSQVYEAIFNCVE